MNNKKDVKLPLLSTQNEIVENIKNLERKVESCKTALIKAEEDLNEYKASVFEG